MKTKHLIFTLLVMLFGFTGCFKEKQELTPQEAQGIFEQAKEIYAQNKGKTNTASNGIMLGIYLKDGNGETRVYEFEDFFNMSESKINEFIVSWGNCIPEESYILFADDKATTIKGVRDNDGNFHDAKTASTKTVADTGYTKDSIVTDGMSNLKEYADEEGPKVIFSSAEGQVAVNTALTLSTVEGGVIRYSEDDSSVTKSSQQYTTAIAITAAKTVRAKAYMSGWVEGAEYKNSYSIYYTVTYNGNGNDGGNAPLDAGKYSANSSIVVLGNIFNMIKVGYKLKEWNTKAAGDGTNYAAGAAISITNDITLYAIWQFDMVDVQSGIAPAINGDQTLSPITLSTPLYAGKYEVTQAEWKAVMSGNINGIFADPSYFKGDDLPVEQISWYDSLVFCNRLSIKHGLIPVYSINGFTDPNMWGIATENINVAEWDGALVNSAANGYRMPVIAEHEYIARGGIMGRATDFPGSNTATDVAWYRSNSDNTTHKVGSKLPNELGIYDISGNVNEWCYSVVSGLDGYHVLMGGRWNGSISGCYVNNYGPGYTSMRRNDYGLRIVRNY